MSATIDKIAWIYLNERKLLCVRSKGKELYYIPGGKRDPGEEDQQTLVREVQEELGVTLNEETIMHIGTFEAKADSKAAGTLVRLTCYTADYAGTLQPDSEIEEMAWLSSADMDRLSVASRLVVEQLKNQELID